MSVKQIRWWSQKDKTVIQDTEIAHAHAETAKEVVKYGPVRNAGSH